jgi:tetratricopeptide (TPR) repeat protein
MDLLPRWLAIRADLEARAGRYSAAELLVRRALVAIGEPDAPADVLGISLLNRLGMIHKAQGRLDEATRAYRRAWRGARRRAHDPRIFAALYHNLGGLEHARGRYARAEPLAWRSVELRERALGPDHADVARDLAALAAIVDGRGRHRAAEVLHRRALQIFERRGLRSHRDTAAALVNLAACLHAQGRGAEAAPLAARALAMSRRRSGASHPETALAASNLSVILRALPAGAGCAPPLDSLGHREA